MVSSSIDNTNMKIEKSTKKNKRKYIKKGFVELTYNDKYKHPIQAKFYKKYNGKIECFYYFTEWNNFKKAIEFFNYKCYVKRCFEVILINKQININY